MSASPKSEAIDGNLYKLLAERLPVVCSESGKLQVAKLAERTELRMSQEGVYRWLRSDEISKRGRTRLVQLGSSPDNLALLREGISPLTEDDLRPFL